MYGWNCKRCCSQSVDEFKLLPSLISLLVVEPPMPKISLCMSTTWRDDDVISSQAFAFNMRCLIWRVYLLEKRSIDMPMEYTQQTTGHKLNDKRKHGLKAHICGGKTETFRCTDSPAAGINSGTTHKRASHRIQCTRLPFIHPLTRRNGSIPRK